VYKVQICRIETLIFFSSIYECYNTVSLAVIQMHEKQKYYYALLILWVIWFCGVFEEWNSRYCLILYVLYTSMRCQVLNKFQFDAAQLMIKASIVVSVEIKISVIFHPLLLLKMITFKYLERAQNIHDYVMIVTYTKIHWELYQLAEINQQSTQ